MRYAGKTMVKIDNEFKMNWAHAADVERERPFITGASQRQCLREATRGVGCLVPARSGARVYQEKVEKTPLVPQDRSIKQCRIGREVPTTRHKVKRMQ